MAKKIEMKIYLLTSLALLTVHLTSVLNCPDTFIHTFDKSSKLFYSIFSEKQKICRVSCLVLITNNSWYKFIEVLQTFVLDEISWHHAAFDIFIKMSSFTSRHVTDLLYNRSNRRQKIQQQQALNLTLWNKITMWFVFATINKKYFGSKPTENGN